MKNNTRIVLRKQGYWKGVSYTITSQPIYGWLVGYCGICGNKYNSIDEIKLPKFCPCCGAKLIERSKDV